METISSTLENLQFTDKLSDNFKLICKTVGNLNCSKEEVTAYVTKFQPKTHLEKFILVKLIDVFQLHNAFVSSLCSEDMIIIPLLLKCTWFFKDESDILSDPSKFVHEIFSQVSCSNQPRLLKMYGRYLRDPQKADNLFHHLSDLYGLKRVLYLLPACSVENIKSILYAKRKDSFATILPREIFEQVYMYHTEFTLKYLDDYFEQRKKCFQGQSLDCEPVLMRILVKNPMHFIEMYNKHYNVIALRKLGKSLTKKLIKTNYQSILNNAQKYCRLFDAGTLVACLSLAQVEEFVMKLMPDTAHNFFTVADGYHGAWPIYLKMLEKVSMKTKKQLLVKVFQSKYNCSLSVQTSLPDEIIQMLPDAERISWAKTALKNPKLSDNQKIHLTAYLGIDESLIELEKLLKTAVEPDDRREIIEAMISSASVNNCVDKISDVFTFVNKRLRNDAGFVKSLAIVKSKDLKLEQLSIEQWEPIVELCNNLIVNDDLNQCRSEMVELYRKLALKRLSAGLPFDTELERIIELYTYQFDLSFATESSFGKQIICWFGKKFENMEFDSENMRRNLIVSLFCATTEWNHKHSNDIIPIAEWMISFLKENYKNSRYTYDINKGLSFVPELKALFYKEFFMDICSPEILLYQLKNNPKELFDKRAEVFSTISDKVVSSYKYFFRRLGYYPTLSIGQSFVDLSIRDLKSDESSTRNKRDCFYTLSLLADHSIFIPLTEPYWPVSSTATMTSENEESYQLAQAIAKYLVHVNPPSAAIPIISRFCQGDYLKMVVGALCSALLKSPEQRALSFLSSNLDSPVSFRKHIIRLIRKIAPIRIVCETLNKALAKEHNFSLRKILLEQLYDLLRLEEKACVWDAVKNSLNSITEEDIKLVGIIFNLNPIPQEYLAFYIESIWAVLLRLREKNDFTQRIFELVNHSSIKVLSEEFCDILFSLCYSPDCDHDSNTISQHNLFISLYLLRESPIDTAARISKVVTHLKKTILPNWDSAAIEDKLSVPDIIKSLVKDLCTSSLQEWARNSAGVISSFQKGLIFLVPEEKALTVYFSLSLYLTYLEIDPSKRRTSLTVFAQHVFPLVDRAIRMYGQEFICILHPLIYDFVSSHFEVAEDENYTANLIRYVKLALTSIEVSRANKIMAIDFIHSFYSTSMCSLRYDSIVQLINSVSDDSLKLYARYRILNF